MILLNKSEAVKIINETLNLYGKADEVKEGNIELCNSRFISKSYFDSESDIIYKLKDKNVLFIIEHQSKVDYTMPVRVAMYSTEIIRRILKEEKSKNKQFKFPKIISIVLYTGERKWTAGKDIRQNEEKFGGDEIGALSYGEYILYAGNTYTDEQLLKQDGVLPKIILLERSKTPEELLKNYDIINRNKFTQKEKEMLDEYTTNVTREKISEEQLKEIREKYKNGGNKSMLAEMLDREYEKKYQMGVKQGISQGIYQLIKKMGANGMNKKEISKITELPMDEIEKILS